MHDEIVKNCADIVIFEHNNDIIYINNTTHEKILLSKSKKIAVIYGNNNFNSNIADVSNTNTDKTTKFLNKNTSTMKYIGTENVNQLECINIEISGESTNSNTFDFPDANYASEDVSDSRIKQKVWIEKTSGLIAKYEIVRISDNRSIFVDFHLQLNTVKDFNVQRPDLSGYKVTYM